MLTTWIAQRLELPVMEQGRTKPLILNCRRTSSEEEENPYTVETRSFLVKAHGLPEVTPEALFNEVVGNLLARRLGIWTPEPALIVLTDEFVRVVNRDLGTRISPGVGAGAAYIPGLANITTPLSPSNEEFGQMVSIYGFDMIVQNPDRRVDNPNCGYRDGRYIAYDFDMCFSFVLAIGQMEHPCAIAKHGIARHHCFTPVLRNKRAQTSWTPLCSQLRRLSAAEIVEITSSTPDSWQTHAEKVINHFSEICNDLGRLELELQGSLT